MLSQDKVDSFELLKTRRKEEIDRSASKTKNTNLFVHSIGEGHGGTDGEGEQGAARVNFIPP